MKVTDKLTITNEDNMKLMSRYPDNYFDLAIVDPPYGIGDVNQKKSRRFHNRLNWNDYIPKINYFEELFRTSKNQIIWGCNYYGNQIKSTGRIVHLKDPKDLQFKELSTCDIASHSFGVNIKHYSFEWRGNVQGKNINWKNEGKNARIHPTQKPVELYEWLLMNYANENDKILDTHLGSGSIALACHNLGFELTACELDKEYFDASINRIKNHISQIRMF